MLYAFNIGIKKNKKLNSLEFFFNLIVIVGSQSVKNYKQYVKAVQ